MSALTAIAITTGILSGLWGWVAISLGLLSWAGFLGCTTYFASPVEGIKGIALSIATNLSGVFWAVLILKLSMIVDVEIMGYVITSVGAFLMCAQAMKFWLSFIPGTFIGACATFASDVNWQIVIPSLILGVLFAYAMKTSGLWLKNKLDFANEKLDQISDQIIVKEML